MNSIAQHAVPNGSGQKEFFCAHSSSCSKRVVIQDSPIIGASLSLQL
jgi:hypothetical protein